MTQVAVRVAAFCGLVLAACALWLGGVLIVAAVRPPPDAVGLAGPPRAAPGLRFLADDSWLEPDGTRRLEQEIFDAVFAAIDGARHLVHVDMFLFNDFQGPEPELHRALSAELVERLAAAASREDAPEVVLVTDPINTVYGGRRSPELVALRAAGVHVVETDLTRLQDSNPVWSGFWRVFVRPFGNAVGDTLPNPLGRGRVTLRSWLALANFKANHRKLLVADAPATSGDDGAREALTIVTSGNPHDGSSAHRNVALEVRGEVVNDVLGAERALLVHLASGPAATAALAAFDRGARAAGLAPTPLETLAAPRGERPGFAPDALPGIALVNESAILDAALGAIDAAGPGDAVDLEMFYLADIGIVDALVRATERGAIVRALLDVNSDAFGRAKNGVPNRPVAAALVAAGAQVRWCATAGEQCHAKWLHVAGADGHAVLLGSGNFTRRNLRDYNLETDLLYRVPTGDGAVNEVPDGAPDEALAAMLARFEALWSNAGARTYSLPYADKADEARKLAWQYQFMERTGLGTF